MFKSKNSQAGFNLIEAILSIATFILLVTFLVGAFLYGQEGTMLAGQRARAVFLAEEGLEAARNIRNAAFTNLTDGAHGLAISANKWTFSGTQDINDIFTRSVTISSIDANRKSIVSTVDWQQNAQRTGTVTLTSRLTFWQRVVSAIGNWADLNTLVGALNISGTNNGLKVQVQGNYAYIVRAGGTPDFAIVNITTPSTPIITGSLSLSGNPINIFVSGNYAYIASDDNSQELQIVDISNPNSPTVAGTYNAAGNGNANGVYVVGTTAYLGRINGGAQGDFLVINVATPVSPILIGALNTSASSFEIYVSGTNAFVASGDNGQELKVISVMTPSAPAVIGFYNTPSNVDATTITGFGSSVILGEGSTFFIINVATAASPALLGSYAASGTVNDISLGNSNNYVFIATASTTKELQVADISAPATPFLVGGFDAVATPNGIAYDAASDRAYLVGPTDTAELYVIAP